MLADILPKVASELRPIDHSYGERPSSAGPERCIRAMTYHCMGAPRDPLPGRALMIFDDSSFGEELTADWIRKTSYRLHSEQMHLTIPLDLDYLKPRTCYTPVSGKPCGQAIDAGNIGGHIDGIITDLVGVDRLWEMKCMNHFTFEKWWKGDFPLDYFTQVSLYMKGLQLINPDITEALLLAKNKNTSQFLEFRLEYSTETDTLTLIEMIRSDGDRSTPEFSMQGITLAVTEKFALVRDYANKKTLPARPFEFGTTFPCEYCGWEKTCWSGYVNEINALASDIALDQDMVDLCAYYLEAAGHESEMKKEKDELRSKIHSLLLFHNAKEGKAGQPGGTQYFVRLRFQDYTSINEDEIPSDILARAKVVNPSERLDIRLLVPKGEKEDKPKRPRKKKEMTPEPDDF